MSGISSKEGESRFDGPRARVTAASELELFDESSEKSYPALLHSLRGKQLVVLVHDKPPEFGADIEVRCQGDESSKSAVKAKITGIVGGVTAVTGAQVHLELSVDAPEAIRKLGATGAKTPLPRIRGRGTPIFSNFDDPPKKQSAKSGKSHTPPLGSQDSGELNWGWVARSQPELGETDIKATPVGDLDVEAIVEALGATGAAPDGSQAVFSKLGDRWSPKPTDIPKSPRPISDLEESFEDTDDGGASEDSDSLDEWPKGIRRPTTGPLARAVTQVVDAGRYSASPEESEVIGETPAKRPAAQTRTPARGIARRPQPGSEDVVGSYSFKSEEPRRTGRKKRPTTHSMRKPTSSVRRSKLQTRKSRRPKTGELKPSLLSEAPIVGIDFGNTHAKVSFFDGAKIVLVEDEKAMVGQRCSIPTLVAFPEGEEPVVGEAAREFLWSAPNRVVHSLKRLFGLEYSNPDSSWALASLGVDHRAGARDEVVLEIGGKELSVEEAAAPLFRHLAVLASKSSGWDVSRAVLTLPADVSERATEQIKNAARRGGIEVIAVLAEPVAAAMGCGFTGEDDALVAVFDYGGGSFDVSYVNVTKDRFALLGHGTDHWLGGSQLDESLAAYLAAEQGVEILSPERSGREQIQRLSSAAEESKRWLSSLNTVDVIVPVEGDEGAAIQITVARELIEQLAEKSFSRALEISRVTAEDCNVQPREVDQLVLTGGVANTPALQAAAEGFFGMKSNLGLHPGYASVIGAALQGASIGQVKTPAKLSEQLRMGPEASHQIGLALADGETEPIIEASKRPPVSAHRLFCTSKESQTVCRFQLVEGVNGLSKKNRKLGVFIIDDLPARPAGETMLDVIFELCSAGTLYVTATDRATGQRAHGFFTIGRDTAG